MTAALSGTGRGQWQYGEMLGGEIGHVRLLLVHITTVRTQTVLKMMKQGKAVGSDGIPVEAFKPVGQVGVELIFQLNFPY